MRVARRLVSHRRLSRFSSTRTRPLPGDEVVLAMSGGVDSSVAACVLAKQGLSVSAVYMRNWDSRDEHASDAGCDWEKDWADVQNVCNMLDIPCRMIDLSREYWLRVFEPALQVWEAGGTPNPDIGCNKEVKFGALAEQVLHRPNQWLATGHYARIYWPPANRTPRLHRAKDLTKDQSYFIASIPPSMLRRVIFPTGDLLKREVRALAKEHNLPTATKEESMGICFVGEKRRFQKFISQYIPPKPGNIVDLAGNFLAQHEGIWSYTIGERARVAGMREKMFVARKDVATNTIVIVPGSSHPALQCLSVTITNCFWTSGQKHIPSIVIKSQGLSVKVRHVAHDVPCVSNAQPGSDTISLTFAYPQHGIAPGQLAVLYSDVWCIGCGTIVETRCMS